MVVTRQGGNTPSGIGREPSVLRVEGLDLPHRITRGLVQGATVRTMSARSLANISQGEWNSLDWDDVTLSPAEPLIGGSNGQVFVRSDSLEDKPTASNSGAHVVRIWGLAAGGAGVVAGEHVPWQSEDINMLGLANAISTLSYHQGMIQGARVITAGSTRSNVGQITVERQSDNASVAVISPGWGESKIERITVPAGWLGVIRSITPQWNGDTVANMRIRLANLEDDVDLSVLGGSFSVENSGNTIKFPGGALVDGLTTFWFQANRSSGGAVNSVMNVLASVEFYLLNDNAADFFQVPIIE